MTHRDDVRARRGELFREAQRLGVDMDAERTREGANQRSLAFQAGKLINDQVPRVTREQMQVDDPPAGAFNGVNTAYTLSATVKGQNIVVFWHSTAANVLFPLAKSNGSPPATHEFYFNPSEPTEIVVGDPPLAADRLIVVFLTER